TVKEAEFAWGEAQETAFNRLKDALCESIVQVYPDFSRPFIVDADASEVGMGAVLSQCDDTGAERVVMIESRKFVPAESKWHIREKEALAIVWALQKFRPYILGASFVVRSDHSSLQWLLQAKSGRLSRWAMELAEYVLFEIRHRQGRSHSNVDAFT